VAVRSCLAASTDHSFHFSIAYFLHFNRWKRLHGTSFHPETHLWSHFGLVYHHLISFFRLYIHGSISGTGHILILSVWETVQWTVCFETNRTVVWECPSCMGIIYKKNILTEEWNEKSLRLGRFDNTFPTLLCLL